MIRILLPVILLALGLGGGIAAGKMLNGPDAEVAAAEDGHGEAASGHGEEVAEDDGHGGGGGGHGEAPDPNSPFEYVRLNNQFIVPIIRHGSVRSLIVMSLTLEVQNGGNTTVFNREPRLRDAFLTVMFSHANVGGFDGSFTTIEAMRPLRIGLLEAAQRVLGDIVHDVLIVDILRQDA